MLYKELLEKDFIFWKYFNTPPHISRKIPIYEREWYIERYIKEKEKESKQLQKPKGH
jgi:hypothetical protein